jgi:hypothetical protein
MATTTTVKMIQGTGLGNLANQERLGSFFSEFSGTLDGMGTPHAKNGFFHIPEYRIQS